jgi:hypothetical protein
MQCVTAFPRGATFGHIPVVGAEVVSVGGAAMLWKQEKYKSG